MHIATLLMVAFVGAAEPTYLMEKEGEIYLGTEVPEGVSNYLFTARAEQARMLVEMEVRDGKLFHLGVKQDKRWYGSQTFVFKKKVVEGIKWTEKSWTDEERFSMWVKDDGELVHVRTHLAMVQCLFSRRMDTQIDYEVLVDGRAVAVHDAYTGYERGWYNFASFAAPTNAPMEIEVRSKSRCMDAAEVLPRSKGWQVQHIDAHTIKWKAQPPFQLAVEPTGRDAPLFLFADASEPASLGSQPETIYFGPGVHKVEVIRPKSGETVYLDEGAVVLGRLEIVDATNVTVRGRGMFSYNHLTRFGGRELWSGPVDVRRSKLVRFEGVTIRGSYGWTIKFRDCEDISIDGIKICGARMINDDGLDICNTSHVTVRNSFIYTADDCFALKGVATTAAAPTDHVRVENCVVWTETANIVRVGWECAAPSFSDYVFRDLYVLHVDEGAGAPPISHPSWSDAIVALECANHAQMHNHLYENIYIDDPRTNVYVASMRAAVFRPECDGGVAGTIRNIRLRNVVATGVAAGERFGRYSAKVVDKDGAIADVSVENAPQPAEIYFSPNALKESISICPPTTPR